MKKRPGRLLKTRRPTTSRKWFDHDVVGVYADGIAHMKKELADMKKWDMKSFAISDFTAISMKKMSW
jgi:hypothetical protein